MTEITLTATEYAEFVFDSVMHQTVGGPALVDTAAGLAGKLMDPSLTDDRPLTPQEQERMAVGRKIWPARVLRAADQTFALSAQEHQLLVALLRNASGRQPLRVLPEYVAMLERVEAAKPKPAKRKGRTPDFDDTVLPEA